MKIIAILSQKGGTGKTTLAINLAVTAAKSLACEVTLIDLDPQASAASWSDSREVAFPVRDFGAGQSIVSLSRGGATNRGKARAH